MSDPTLLVLLLPALLVPVIIFAARRSQQRRFAALDETLRHEASARGWSLETERRGRIRVIRWKGDEAGVRWQAESVKGQTGQGSARRRFSHTRWRTTGMHGGSAITLFMGMPEGTDLPKVHAADGMLASLALKAMMYALDRGLDLYFGTDVGAEIDAAALKRVAEAEASVPGFAVMATVPSEASRIVFQGIGAAIDTAINQGPDALREKRRPWVLVWKGGVALGRVDAAESAADIEPFVHAGTAIVRSLH